MMTRTGSSGERAFGFNMKTSKRMRCWSLRMNALCTSSPKSGRRGCRKGRKERS